MKKATSIFSCLLFGLSTLLLAGKLLCHSMGYRFELANLSVYAVIISVLAVGTSILSMISGKTESIIVRILLISSVPLSLFNILLYLVEYPSVLVYISMIITAGLTLFLAVWHGKHLMFRLVGAASATIILLLFCYIGFFCLIFGSIGYTTVIQTAVSPNGEYRAEVLDVNQGALGGDTIVEAYENRKHINLCVLSISKKPQRVYVGNWGEFEKMKIYWKDDLHLVINSLVYEIE